MIPREGGEGMKKIILALFLNINPNIQGHDQQGHDHDDDEDDDDHGCFAFWHFN